MERLTDSLDWFTHGWHAFVGAWLVVIVGMWAGLWLRGANRGRFLTAPIAAAFVALLAMLAAAALKTGLDAAGIAGPLRAYGTFAIFPLFGLLAGLLSSDPARTVMHRGAVIQDGGRSSDGGGEGELTLAGIPIPPMDETKHFKMIGTTGTGKSTAIRELLEGALARGDRAVIADPDGGYLTRFYDPSRGDVILNPFDPRAHTWNIYGELTASHDVEQLARSLIPDHEGSDKSWRGYARTFFTALARQTNDAGVRDLNELYRLTHLRLDRRTPDPHHRHTRATVPRKRQRTHVRLDPLRHRRLAHRARLPRRADRAHPSACATGCGRAGECCSCPTRPTRSRHCARSSRRGCASRSSRP